MASLFQLESMADGEQTCLYEFDSVPPGTARVPAGVFEPLLTAYDRAAAAMLAAAEAGTRSMYTMRPGPKNTPSDYCEAFGPLDCQWGVLIALGEVDWALARRFARNVQFDQQRSHFVECSARYFGLAAAPARLSAAGKYLMLFDVADLEDGVQLAVRAEESRHKSCGNVAGPHYSWRDDHCEAPLSAPWRVAYIASLAAAVIREHGVTLPWFAYWHFPKGMPACAQRGRLVLLRTLVANTQVRTDASWVAGLRRFGRWRRQESPDRIRADELYLREVLGWAEARLAIADDPWEFLRAERLVLASTYGEARDLARWCRRVALPVRDEINHCSFISRMVVASPMRVAAEGRCAARRLALMAERLKALAQCLEELLGVGSNSDRSWMSIAGAVDIWRLLCNMSPGAADTYEDALREAFFPLGTTFPTRLIGSSGHATNNDLQMMLCLNPYVTAMSQCVPAVVPAGALLRAFPASAPAFLELLRTVDQVIAGLQWSDWRYQ